MYRKSTTILTSALCALSFALTTRAAPYDAAPVFGPFNGLASGSGPGHVEWFNGPPPTEANAAWTISAWVKPAAAISAQTIVAGFGDGTDYIGGQRYLCADSTGWFFWYGGSSTKKHVLITVQDRLATQVAARAGTWQHVAATYDGKTLLLYVDGKEAGRGNVILTRASMQPMVAPPPGWKEGACFTGRVAQFRIFGSALSGQEIAQLAESAGNLDASVFTPAPVGPTPVNRSDIMQFANGERNPGVRRADLLPGPVPPVTLNRTPKLTERPIARPNPDGELTLNCGWEMAEATTVNASPERISSPGFDTHAWYDATVPGTALTTLVQQGIYPEPTHGLNNLLIPNLATKSWWYRVVFPTAAAWRGRNIGLLFKGINYHAEIWLNGRYVGDMTGAFIRGRFDVTSRLIAPGNNVLAVRIWPQPHYTQGLGEASAKGGPGSNGSDGMLDGPTFFCTEGWDWIPMVRDRCTGIWQDVVLKPTGAVTVNDPQVITKLPKLPDLSVAEVTLKADVRNITARMQSFIVEAELGGTRVSQNVSLAANEVRTVAFTPSDFPQLVISSPSLWWPNGYGAPFLYDLHLRVLDPAGVQSDSLSERVGLRQMDYGYLPKPNKPEVKDGPFYIIVNGRRIFAHGGNWGLDEMLKRSSTARLEPCFRLEHDAGLNIIRNWTGQDTQDNFYELADKYGLMVWNDFWLSTENCNVPAVNAEGFMANANDVIKRYRTHACIAVWCGRNEGTPPVWLNFPLAESTQELDGTRIYIPSSKGGKLMGTGPWTYQDPKWYYTTHSKGFCTELGSNSIPTVDALKGMLDPSQYWPWQNNDAWAYHNFPSKSHGYVVPFREAAETRYGVGNNLEEFIRRMQMQNYTQHRVMLEAFNSKMWRTCSGVFLWMSHPDWPSMVWQLYTSDYEPNASYFGAKKACEMVHVQWDVVDDAVSVVNASFEAIPQATLKIVVCGLDSTILKTMEKTVDLDPSTVIKPAKVEWAAFAAQPVQFLKLELRDKDGKLLSENFYWQSDPGKPEQMRALETLPQVKLDGDLSFTRDRGETVATINLANVSRSMALMTHLVLRDAANGARVLPAYPSDDYLSFLPGERKTITIRCAIQDAPNAMNVSLDGWNIVPATLSAAR